MSKVAEGMEYYEIYLDTMSADEAMKMLIDAGFIVIKYYNDVPTDFGLVSVYGIQNPIEVFNDIRQYPSNMSKEDPFYKPFIYVW